MEGLYILGSGRRQLIHRFSAGIAIKLDSGIILIDPGVGTLVRASQVGLNLSDTKFIVVTKNSYNHCSDVNAIADIIASAGKKCSLIGCDAFINKSSLLTDEAKNSFDKVIVLKPEQEITLDNIRFSGLPAKSNEESSIGLKLEIFGLRLCYSSDTEYFDELLRFFKGEIFIFNVGAYGKKYVKHELNTEDVIRISKENHPKLVILTHFDKDYERNPIYEARDVNQATGVQCVAANDGMFVDFGMYLKKV
jgi:ribonuclease BN (tRNA processing enzyme)